MKFNWGWGILIVIVLFITFILNLVYRCTLQRVDLVTEKYYERELAFQKQIDQEENAAALQQKLLIRKTGNAVMLTYPDSGQPESVTGEITFFKPDDARQDFKVTVHPDKEFVQSIDVSGKKTGWWSVQVSWMDHGISYYSHEKILID